MICQRRVSLLNNVYFDQKLVSLFPNIRLLVRDEWILLDKDHQPIGKNILELPRSVKRAWSPVEALLGSCLLK